MGGVNKRLLMKGLRILLVVLSLFCVTTLMATEPSNIVVTIEGKAYYKHMVEKGDTLYSLSKTYGVSEQEILDSNVSLSAATLRAGEYIFVPRKVVGSAYDAVRDDNMKEGEHRVMAGETLYSLSRRYGITEDELLALNGLSDYTQLKAGMVIRVCGDVDVQEDVATDGAARVDVESGEARSTRRSRGREDRSRESDVVVEEQDTMTLFDRMLYALGFGEDADSVNIEQVDVTFPPLSRHHTLKMALMLPFHMNNKVNPNYVDFYRGVLVALEDIKGEGYDVALSVLDTQGSGERIKDIMDFESGMLDAQLIIGPVYENELRHVVGYAEDNEIPVVSPLADIEILESPVLFQMQAESDHKYDKLADIFDGSREIITIYASTIDANFAQDMRSLSTMAPGRDINFVFDRESFFYRRNADGSNGEQIDIMELMQSKSSKAYVIVAQNETEVDRILTTLSSTKSNIVARSISYGDYVVVGNRRWTQSANIDHQSFFRNNVLFIMPYYANRSSENIRLFDSRYVEMYGVLPSMYAYRGYDAVMIFCRKMYSGIDDSLFDEVFTPLATTYHFVKEDGIYVNDNWMRVQYNGNFTIDVQ